MTVSTPNDMILSPQELEEVVDHVINYLEKELASRSKGDLKYEIFHGQALLYASSVSRTGKIQNRRLGDSSILYREYYPGASSILISYN